MRIIFAGTPELSAQILAGLIQSQHQVEAVLTQPDRPAGRGMKVRQSAVKTLARQHLIAVFEHSSLKKIRPDEYLPISPDVIVTAAYGILLPKHWLSWPTYGVLNIHPSLLPEWRGAAPIERALLSGNSQTGVSIMLLDSGLDTGPVLAQKTCTISPQDTSDSLSAKLFDLGLNLLLDTLKQLDEDFIKTAKPQESSGITYAHKITSQDSRIDWSEDAHKISCKIRAMISRNPAFAFINKTRIRFFEAQVVMINKATSGTILEVNKNELLVQCGQNSLKFQKIQIDRGQAKILSIADVMNGFSSFLTSGQAFDLL